MEDSLEIMPTPESVKESASKGKLTNNKVKENVYLNKNEVLSSITNQTKLSPDNHKEEEIIETYLTQPEHELKSPKILNNQDETKKKSKLSSKKNPLKSNSHSVKCRKLLSVNEEDSLMRKLIFFPNNISNMSKISFELQNKKKVQLNSATENIPKPEEQQLNKEQLPLVNKEQNEEVFKSVYEVEIGSMQNSSPKTSGVFKIEKKTHSREKDLSKFGVSLLKIFLKNIEETKTTLQTERQAVYTTFISYLDEQKRNNLQISGQLEKCRKALEKTDNEIEMVRQNVIESILKLELKQNKIFVNHLKDLKSEMKEIVKIYIEEK